MRKNKENRRFIQSCYYKLKAHRSLSNMSPNPLLVPSSHCQSTLCGSSTKKYNQHMHKTTFSNWLIDQRLSSYQNKKIHKKINCKSKYNLQDSIVSYPIKYISQSNRLKMQNQAKQLKQQRRKIFREQCKLGHKTNQQRKNQENDKTRTKNIPQFQFNRNYDHNDKINEKNLRKIKNTRYCQRTQDQPIIMLRKIPNKRRQSVQYIKNQSNFQFTGWDLDQIENEELIVTKNQKHQHL